MGEQPLYVLDLHNFARITNGGYLKEEVAITILGAILRII